MIVITDMIGNLSSLATGTRCIDRFPVEWYEAGKRILRRRSTGGTELALRFLNSSAPLRQDDVLWEDEACVIAVEIRSCDVIRLQPQNHYDTARAAYEIGNRHLPLFFDEGSLMMPYDAPVFRMLEAAGFGPRKENARLLHPLRTGAAPHSHGGGLLTRILDWTNTETNER